jgi:hypothetical protein
MRHWPRCPKKEFWDIRVGNLDWVIWIEGLRNPELWQVSREIPATSGK